MPCGLLDRSLVTDHGMDVCKQFGAVCFLIHGVSAAGEVKDEQLHEPCSRCFHYAATLEGKLCVWGGLPDHHFEEEKAIYHHDTKSTIEVYDPHLEEWRALPTKGPSPPGYCRGASASGDHYFYVFGEGNYDPFKVATEVSYDSLYQCDVHSCTWMLLSEHIAGGRLATEGCSIWCTMSTPWSCLEVMDPLVTFNQVPAVMADTLMSCTFIS